MADLTICVIGHMAALMRFIKAGLSGFPEKQGVFHCQCCFCSKNNDHSKGVIVFQRSQLGFRLNQAKSPVKKAIFADLCGYNLTGSSAKKVFFAAGMAIMVLGSR